MVRPVDDQPMASRGRSAWLGRARLAVEARTGAPTSVVLHRSVANERSGNECASSSSMTRARPLPAQLADRPFRVAEALSAGVHAERLRRRDLRAPVHGVRVRAGGASPDFIDAIAVVMRPDQYFSHTTAASLWGAPLPRSIEESGTVHVSTRGTEARMRRPNVVGHRSSTSTVVELGGRRLSSPADAWFECAGELGLGALVAVGDHLVGPSGLATIADLAAALVPGGRHVTAARHALDRVRVGSESAMETWFRLAVVDAGFPEPELNVEVLDDDGRFLGRVDMAWPEHRIALEYDGDHHRERETFRHDQRRDNGFAVNDWVVVHATAADRPRPALLFERLRQAFGRRTSTTTRADRSRRVSDRLPATAASGRNTPAR